MRERSIGWISFSSHAYFTKSAPDSRLSTGATRSRSARACAEGLSHGLTVMPVRFVNSCKMGSRRLNVAPTTFSSLPCACAAGDPSATAAAAIAPPFTNSRRVVVMCVIPSCVSGPVPSLDEPEEQGEHGDGAERDDCRHRADRVERRLQLPVELRVNHERQRLFGAGREETPRELVVGEREAEQPGPD